MYVYTHVWEVCGTRVYMFSGVNARFSGCKYFSALGERIDNVFGSECIVLLQTYNYVWDESRCLHSGRLALR